MHSWPIILDTIYTTLYQTRSLLTAKAVSYQIERVCRHPANDEGRDDDRHDVNRPPLTPHENLHPRILRRANQVVRNGADLAEMRPRPGRGCRGCGFAPASLVGCGRGLALRGGRLLCDESFAVVAGPLGFPKDELPCYRL